MEAFKNKKWGVFTHYLYSIQNQPECVNNMGAGKTDWNDCIDSVDVESIAFNLHKMGADYYFFTMMQGTEFLAAPNETYDRIMGVMPGELCARRDIVLDLYDALSKYDIDLYLYYTGDGPYKNPVTGRKIGFTEPVTRMFVENWASVLQEYAVRYGDKVKGWWIDGCYSDYFHYNEELLSIYKKAVKKGNPDAAVAFNNGVKEEFYRWGEGDFCSGEYNDFTHIPPCESIDGAKPFVLAPLGTKDMGIGAAWGAPGVCCEREELAGYIRKVNSRGGVVTVDIAIFRDGSFDKEQIEVLSYVGKNI